MSLDNSTLRYPHYDTDNVSSVIQKNNIKNKNKTNFEILDVSKFPH